MRAWAAELPRTSQYAKSAVTVLTTEDNAELTQAARNEEVEGPHSIDVCEKVIIKQCIR